MSAQRLTGRQSAERAGITYNAWKLTPRTKLGRPPADGIDQLSGQLWWRPSTIDAWRAERIKRRRPTHAEVIAAHARGEKVGLHYRVIRRHLARHDKKECRCYQ